MKNVGRAAGLVLGFATVLSVSKRALAEDLPTFADDPPSELDDVDRKIVLMMDPLSMAEGMFGGEADLALGPWWALALQADVCRPGAHTEAALGMGLLIYPFNATFHGFYLEPSVAYVHPLKYGMFQVGGRSEVALASVEAGWQWTWEYGFALRVGGGAAIDSSPSMSAFPARWPTSARVAMVTDTSLGWAW
jgi:hypothetical protein